MKTKSILLTATFFATLLALVSTVQAGGWAGFRKLDVGTARTSMTANPGSNFNGARANRRGMDDPANHDLNDDRGGNGEIQPGDDRGRHHRRGRGR